MGHKVNAVLSKYINLGVLILSIFDGMLTHGKTKCLTYNIVKRYNQEKPSQKKESHSIHSVKLSPFRFFLENLINLNCLSSFLNRKRQSCFIFFHYLGFFMILWVKHIVLFNFFNLFFTGIRSIFIWQKELFFSFNLILDNFIYFNFFLIFLIT